MLYALGDSAADVLTTFVFTDPRVKEKCVKLKSKFDEYFIVRRNHDVIYERAKFNQRKQKVQEVAEVFVTSSYCPAERMIRDRIVVGERLKA